jgi:hypothetical protein
MNWVVTGVLIAMAVLLGSMVRAFVRAIVESYLTALRSLGNCLAGRMVLELSPTMAAVTADCVSSQIGARIPSAPRAPPLIHPKDPALKLNPLFVWKATAFQRSDVSWLSTF